MIEAQSHVTSGGFVVDTNALFPPTITDKAKYDIARREMTENNSLANSDLSALGRTFVGNANAIATLNRYESSLEKSFYKALHELQRLQAARKGENVPLPVAIDVHGDVDGEAL